MEIVIDSVFGGLGMIGCFNCLITGIWLQPDCPITLSEMRNFFTLYVVSRFCDDIKYMTNKPPRFIWKWCWKIISPVTIFLVLSMSIKSMSETTPQYSVWDASKVLVLPYKLSHFQRYKPYYQRNETYLKAYLDYFSYDPHQSNDKCPSDPQGVTDLKAKVSTRP